MDYNHGNKVVNDATISIDTTGLNALELNAHLRIQNNTDKPLALFMKKIVNQVVDSTSNYFCLYPKCWPDADSTDIADSIPAGLSDSSFVTHYDHYFRYERPIPPGLTSITYLFYDHATFPEPVEAKVTVNYRISGVGIPEVHRDKLSVYPFPASDLLCIAGQGGLNDPVKDLKLFDFQGHFLSDFSYRVTDQGLMVDISKLKNGMYVVLVQTLNAKPETARIVVQH